MALKLSNNAISLLSASLDAGGLSLSVIPGEGSRFPTLSVGDYFPLTLIRASDGAIEIVRVTDRSSDVMTIQRAKEGTSALSFAAGDRVELRMTAATFSDEIARVETKADADQSTADAIQATAEAAQSTANGALQRSGGVMTGPTTLSGNATENLHAVPKQQLDAALAAKMNSAATIIPAGTNIDTVIQPGFYRFNGSVVGLPFSNYGQLFVSRGYDTITQIYGDYTTGRLYTRSGNPPSVGGPGVWSPWRSIIDDSIINDYIAYYLQSHGGSGVTSFNGLTGAISNTDLLRDHTFSIGGDIAQNGGGSAEVVGGLNGTMVELINKRVRAAGTFRVTWTMRRGSYGENAYGQVYKNGVAAGVKRTTSSTVDVTYTDDITVNIFDTIQIFAAYSGGGGSTFVKIVKIGADRATYLSLFYTFADATIGER